MDGLDELIEEYGQNDAHFQYITLKYKLIYELGEINKLLQKYNISNEDFSKIDNTFQKLIPFIETAKEL